MKRTFLTLSVVATAALMLTACEDRGQDEQIVGEEEVATTGGEQELVGAGEQGGEEPQRTLGEQLVPRSETLTMQGEVTELEPKEGTMTIQTTEGRSVELQGMPQQLAQYELGQQASVQLQSFEGFYWLASPPSQQAAGEGQTAQGQIESLDKPEGKLTLRGAEPGEFRAHPESLLDLQPGQMVSVTYESNEQGNWVNEIQGQQQGTQEQQQGTQEQQQGAQEQQQGAQEQQY